jgi:hypothetical protein
LSIRNIKIRQCYCEEVAIDTTKKIAGFGVYLILLEISDKSITDDIIVIIIEGCPNIEDLDVPAGCPKNTDISMIKVAENCPHLKFLDLTYLTYNGNEFSRNDYITDNGIIKAAEGCPK